VNVGTARTCFLIVLMAPYCAPSVFAQQKGQYIPAAAVEGNLPLVIPLSI
jgi:hypothetical protein